MAEQIALMGARSSGKSTYLVSLWEELVGLRYFPERPYEVEFDEDSTGVMGAVLLDRLSEGSWPRNGGMEELAGGELVAVIRDRRRFPWLGHEPKEVAIGEWRTIGGETSDRAGKKGGRRRTRPGPWTDSKVAGISAVIVLVDGTKLEEGAANVSRKVQRIATGVTDAVDGVQRLREVNGGSWDLFDSGGKLRVAVAIAKTDRMRRETVVAGMAMLDGDDPPRMAGRETELHESLIHLSYLRRRLIGQDCEVKPFAVSALEALKEGGAVSDTQARRLDQEFAPNGLGTDVLAPLRWCIERRRGWLV